MTAIIDMTSDGSEMPVSVTDDGDIQIDIGDVELTLSYDQAHALWGEMAKYFAATDTGTDDDKLSPGFVNAARECLQGRPDDADAQASGAGRKRKGLSRNPEVTSEKVTKER